LQLEHDPRQPRLDTAIAAGDRIGAGKESSGPVRIIQRDGKGRLSLFDPNAAETPS